MALAPREILVVYGSHPVDSVAAAVGGNTAYTLEDVNGDGVAPSWIKAGAPINFYSCINAANNGTYVVQSVAGLVVTANNAAGVLEASNSPGLAGCPVGGVSNFHYHDKHTHSRGYKTQTVEFDAVIQDTVEATYTAKKLSIEQAFRLIRQRLRVLKNAQVWMDFNPATEAGGNTGFNQEPQIQKLGDNFDTGWSSRYHVTVELQLPADLQGVSGRQDSQIDVTFDASKIATLTISGRYTALGANGARAQYNAAIATYAAAVQSFIDNTVTWELVTETAIGDDQDKNLDFTRIYRELIYNQSSGSLDNATVVNGTFNYTRQQVAPGDSDSSARRLETLIADFRCSMDKNQSTDPNGFWESTIRPYINEQVRSHFGSRPAALTDQQVDVGRDGNTLQGRLVFQAVAEAAGNLIQVTKSLEIRLDTGKVLVPVWDGNAFAKHVYQGPADKLRTARETKLVLGAHGQGGASQSNPAAGGVTAFSGLLGGLGVGSGFQHAIQIGDFSVPLFGPNSGAAQTALVEAVINDDQAQAAEAAALGGESGWILLTKIISTTPIIIGLPGYQLELTEIVTETIEAWVEAPSQGGGGVAT